MMRTTIVFGAAAAVLAVATPATAAVVDGTGIDYVESGREGLQILVSVPPDATVDTDNVAVTIDGTDAPAVGVPADSTTSVRRTAVLVIDTSNSMSGERIDAARAAALTFVDSVPDDVYVGIVSFDSDVTAELEPTTDRGDARAVIEDLQLNQQTRLYDGVLAGLAMLGSEGQRQLLVLSDGADTSDTELSEVTADVADADTQVNVVSLEQEQPTALRALEELATSGGGDVIKAGSDALGRAFTAQADILARQILVTAQVPESVTVTEATVSVTLGSDIGDLTAEAFAPIGEQRQTEAGGDPAGSSDTGSLPLLMEQHWFYGGLAALGLGLMVMLLMFAPRKQSELTGAALATTYTERVSGIGGKSDDLGVEQAAAAATNTAAKVLGASKSLEVRISERLDGAGNPFKPAEWLVLHVSAFVVIGAIGLLLGSGNLIVGLLSLVLGAMGPWFYLGFRRSRRRRAFERSLPDILQLISGSLAAGLSLAQSLDTVVKEGQEPMSTEFRRVLIETRLGISLDDALEGVSDRFESKDFAWVVMAIRIQRQVGGNLAELLDTVAATMREREYMRRQVAALAAEGKLSAWVLGGLPPAFMVYLLLTKRDYVMPMFTDPMGWAMLGGAATLLGVGVFWMSRLVKVEV